MTVRPDLQALIAAFNMRPEVLWAGLEASIDADGGACIQLSPSATSALEGTGSGGLNGGLIAAGFDAAVILAALMAAGTDVVVTASLTVNYLRPAQLSHAPQWRASVTRSGRAIIHVEARLEANGETCATAVAVTCPRERRPALTPLTPPAPFPGQ
jgi:acyl-coenzyme A thioesterase PaaI-like protein